MLIVISISGNLYFANVVAGDRTDDVGYVCISNNEKLRSLSKGDDEGIVPVGSPGTDPSSPQRGCRVTCLVTRLSSMCRSPGGAVGVPVSKMAAFSVLTTFS